MISIEEGAQLLIGKGLYRTEEIELVKSRISDLNALGISVENAVTVLSTIIEPKKTQQYIVLAQVRRTGTSGTTKKYYDILNSVLLDMTTWEILPSVRLGTFNDKPDSIITRFPAFCIIEGTLDVTEKTDKVTGTTKKYINMIGTKKVSDGLTEKDLISKINANPKFSFDKSTEEITKKLSEFDCTVDSFSGNDGRIIETMRCNYTFPIPVGITSNAIPDKNKITVKGVMFGVNGKMSEITLNYPIEMIDKIYLPNSRLIVIGDLNMNSRNQIRELSSIDVYVSFAMSGVPLSNEDKENIMLAYKTTEQQSGQINKDIPPKPKTVQVTDIEALLRGGA